MGETCPQNAQERLKQRVGRPHRDVSSVATLHLIHGVVQNLIDLSASYKVSSHNIRARSAHIEAKVPAAAYQMMEARCTGAAYVHTGPRPDRRESLEHLFTGR